MSGERSWLWVLKFPIQVWRSSFPNQYSVPDLVFSEMRFLRKKESTSENELDPSESKQEKKKSKLYTTQDGMSKFFAARRPPLAERDANLQPQRGITHSHERTATSDSFEGLAFAQTGIEIAKPTDGRISATTRKCLDQRDAACFAKDSPGSVNRHILTGSPLEIDIKEQEGFGMHRNDSSVGSHKIESYIRPEDQEPQTPVSQTGHLNVLLGSSTKLGRNTRYSGESVEGVSKTSPEVSIGLPLARKDLPDKIQPERARRRDTVSEDRRLPRNVGSEYHTRSRFSGGGLPEGSDNLINLKGFEERSSSLGRVLRSCEVAFHEPGRQSAGSKRYKQCLRQDLCVPNASPGNGRAFLVCESPPLIPNRGPNSIRCSPPQNLVQATYIESHHFEDHVSADDGIAALPQFEIGENEFATRDEIIHAGYAADNVAVEEPQWTLTGPEGGIEQPYNEGMGESAARKDLVFEGLWRPHKLY
jgi:hypothetical protein